MNRSCKLGISNNSIGDDLQTAVFQLYVVKALHADDGEEVVDEEQHEDGRGQAGDEDDGRAEHVAESLLHPEQGQEPRNVVRKIWSEMSIWKG